MYNKTGVTYNEYLDWLYNIKEIKKKADKWDDIPISYNDIISQNKQLKEKLKGFENLGSFLYSKESEYQNLKQKLEKIKELNEHGDYHGIKEILKEKV